MITYEKFFEWSNYKPPENTVLSLEPKSCIYPVRVYDPNGNLKEEISVKQLLQRQEKEVKKKRPFNAII